MALDFYFHCQLAGGRSDARLALLGIFVDKREIVLKVKLIIKEDVIFHCHLSYFL